MLLMLEDDPERIQRFTETCHRVEPTLPLLVWRDAHSMIRDLPGFLHRATILSLDHDLEPETDGPDPGEGLQVVKYLVSQPIVRPVIIHSSNGERASWMGGEFDLAGWKWYRVVPLGEDDWIEVDWRRTLRRVLRKVRRSN